MKTTQDQPATALQKYLRQKVADAVRDLHLPVTANQKVHDVLAAEAAAKIEKLVDTTVKETITSKAFYRACDTVAEESRNGSGGGSNPPGIPPGGGGAPGAKGTAKG